MNAPERQQPKPKSPKLVEGTAIKSCACKHPYQDKRYGKGKRVHNATRRLIGTMQAFRCGVCSTERT